tara:strand:+ start:58 stop:297 length:240 start_codon:yes stop_codon:yes gene_type:complete
MVQYIPAAIAAFNFLKGASAPPQVQPTPQPTPGNPSAAMRFMPKIPMATFNPGQMGGGIFDDQDLMMMMQQAPPRGLLY